MNIRFRMSAHLSNFRRFTHFLYFYLCFNKSNLIAFLIYQYSTLLLLYIRVIIVSLTSLPIFVSFIWYWETVFLWVNITSFLLYSVQNLVIYIKVLFPIYFCHKEVVFLFWVLRVCVLMCIDIGKLDIDFKAIRIAIKVYLLDCYTFIKGMLPILGLRVFSDTSATIARNVAVVKLKSHQISRFKQHRSVFKDIFFLNNYIF